jgi:S1-C subfamily serine protease
VRVIAAATLLVISCSGRVEVATPENRVPAEMEHAVQFHNDDGSSGWAMPYDLERLLTVAHLMDKPGGRWITRHGEYGPAVVMWKDKRRDIAVLQAEDDGHALFPLIKFADRMPEPLAPVYYKFYLSPGHSVVVGRGYFIGVDSDGDISLDAATYPGSSGSPVLDSRGRCIGLISRGWQQAAPMPSIVSALDALQILSKRTMFRASVIVTPLVGGVPERNRE